MSKKRESSREPDLHEATEKTVKIENLPTSQLHIEESEELIPVVQECKTPSVSQQVFDLNELMDPIFDYLDPIRNEPDAPDYSALLSCTLVSRRFYDVAIRKIWRFSRISFEEFPHEANQHSDLLRIVSKNRLDDVSLHNLATHIKALQIGGEYWYAPEYTRQPVDIDPRRMDFAQLRKIVRFVNLRYLSIQGPEWNLDYIPMTLEACPVNLQILKIKGQRFSQSAFEGLLIFQDLRSLYLSDNRYDVDSATYVRTISTCILYQEQLQDLHVQGTGTQILVSIASNTSLKWASLPYISIKGIRELEKQADKGLSWFCSLERLSMEVAEHLTWGYLDILFSMMPSLNTLDLWYAAYDWEGFARLRRQCPQLKRLSISFDKDFNDNEQDVLAIVDICGRLEKFEELTLVMGLVDYEKPGQDMSENLCTMIGTSLKKFTEPLRKVELWFSTGSWHLDDELDEGTKCLWNGETFERTWITRSAYRETFASQVSKLL